MKPAIVLAIRSLLSFTSRLNKESISLCWASSANDSTLTLASNKDNRSSKYMWYYQLVSPRHSSR